MERDTDEGAPNLQGFRG